MAALILAAPVQAAPDQAAPVQAAPAQTASVHAASASGFRLLARGVTPKDAIPLSVNPIRFHFRFKAKRPLHLSIRVKKLATGKTLRRIVTGRLVPARWHHIYWNGLTQQNRLAPAGRYLVVAGPIGGPLRRVGRIRLHSHEFPVDGPHGTRGYIGSFGAPRVDGRTHEGFDITAACGTPLVAVRAGTIIKKAYDPDLYGNFIVLKGEGEKRTYKYAHLIRPAPVRRGQKVMAGRRVGSVGQTGNAASTPCHLHLEIRTRGNLLNPQPLVNSWTW